MAFEKFSFLDDFSIPNTSHDEIKQQLLKSGVVKNVKKRTSLENVPLKNRIQMITDEVYKVLGRYKGFVKVIRDEQEFNDYIDKAINLNILSFDTETNNSLDPLTCKLMGLCMYLPNTKPVYVPLNHTKVGTDILIDNQVSEECVTKAFQRLKDSNTRIIYHNGKFDIRVCYNVTGVRLPIWWDTMIGAQLLNENELARLKYQYKAHIDPTIGSYNIEKLFTGLPYAWIDPEVFALYAAIDAYDTYTLQQYQQKLFEQDDLKNMYRLFNEIEIPIVSVVSEMEDNGICLDVEFLKKLNDKYEKKRKETEEKLNEMLAPYEKQINYYREIGKLDDPVNFESPPQLSLVLYDILKTPIPESGKSTDKTTLKALKTSFTKAVLNYRHYSKLISGFTEPLPSFISTRDGKLHANFHQMGKEENNVVTGRFSSSNPNLQQIPSHERVLRMAFKASPGYCIVGGDYSQQEPRLLTHMTRDENLIDTYSNKRDLYATVGSKVFHRTYWECMEHWEDGSPNPEGKEIRSKCKSIVLGIMYGMGAKLLATILGVSIEECRSILDEFYKMFPSVKEFTVGNEQNAKELGFVEDYFGRRRHLPDAGLSEIEIRAKKTVITSSDVFFDCGIKDCKVDVADKNANDLWEKKWEDFKNSAEGKKFNSKNKFKEFAKDNGIDIYDNGSFISRAMTQCTNARIQGSAATLTKKAMVSIANDEKMKELGFKLLIPVHDELLGECPKENTEEAEKRLVELMIGAANPECSVPMKVDTYAVCHWYADEVANLIEKDYNMLLYGDSEKGIEPKTEEEAFKTMANDYPELSEDILLDMCLGRYDLNEERL